MTRTIIIIGTIWLGIAFAAERNTHHASVAGAMASFETQAPTTPLEESVRLLQMVHQPSRGTSAEKGSGYQGTFIHIEPDGFRRTLNNIDEKDATAKIYVFGGSAIWGFGARDENTIPSLLGELLKEAGYETVYIYNEGQLSYFSRHDLAKAVSELGQPTTPTICLFYEGWNDAFSNAENYLKNIGELQSIAKAGGLEAFFFLQPARFLKAKLSREEELAERGKLETPGSFLETVKATYAELKTSRALFDLTKIFGNSRETFFTDNVHLTEAGNLKVAQAIVQQLTRQSRKLKAAYHSRALTSD